MNRIFIVLTIFSFTFNDNLFAHVQPKDELVAMERGFFPDTWTCPYCGYENFEGISACAVCGR